ncbi:MAG TPA: 2-amino-4-hydroxy-6-hydroxymethyldihydropteridine diphosphokinase [Planctomycetaceae bacterium]|nr:2-amino-4-hydroxy-6-hydroxymethyldihydropteridine diphosphokinase [Planctomycetaceae bacterium]
MTKIFLSLGSNIAATCNLPAAVRLLSNRGNLLAISSVWQSPAVGFPDQDDFLNAAVMLESDVSASGVYQEWIADVENQLDRERDPNNKNAPRTIDVDLSLYGNRVLTVLGHQIPDPDILTRHHVAIPLAELDAMFVHPSCRLTLAEIAASLQNTGGALIRRDDVDLRHCS